MFTKSLKNSPKARPWENWRNCSVETVLRIGLAFAFLYPPISAFFNPFSWIGYFPQFLLTIVGNEQILLHTFGIIEIIIGVWLLWGKHIIYPTSAALVLLLGIVIFNFSQMDVLFRDISIAAIALALIINNLSQKEY